MLGRHVKTEKSGFNGTVTSQSYYNSKSQLIKVSTTGQADTLFEYDDIGNRIRSGLDVNAPAGWYSLQRKKFILSVPGININVRNGERATPLITATIQKDFEYVKLLLENGVNVHAKDNNGMTAMDLAKELKQKQIISELCHAMQKTRPIKK